MDSNPAEALTHIDENDRVDWAAAYQPGFQEQRNRQVRVQRIVLYNRLCNSLKSHNPAFRRLARKPVARSI